MNATRAGGSLSTTTLRVAGRDDLWAGGDCAAVPHPHGGTCPPVATYGIAHGAHIGRNLSRTLAGEPTSRSGPG